MPELTKYCPRKQNNSPSCGIFLISSNRKKNWKQKKNCGLGNSTSAWTPALLSLALSTVRCLPSTVHKPAWPQEPQKSQKLFSPAPLESINQVSRNRFNSYQNKTSTLHPIGEFLLALEGTWAEHKTWQMLRRSWWDWSLWDWQCSVLK